MQNAALSTLTGQRTTIDFESITPELLGKLVSTVHCLQQNWNIQFSAKLHGIISRMALTFHKV